jgi:long-chain acyl-CoA synthetase
MTLGDLIVGGAERFAEREAVADAHERLTYAQLAASVFALARGVRRLGLAPGDRGLVVLPNGVNFVRAHFANLLAGVVSVPCDAGLTRDSLRTLCASCRPRVLFTDAATLQRLTAEPGTTLEVEHVVVFGTPPPGSVGVDARELAGNEADGPFSPAAFDDDLAVLMYTTGTTGRPKGVRLSHANVLAVVRNIVSFAGYTSDDREVVVLPLSHNFGLGHLYCNLMSGGAVYAEPGLARVKRVLDALESFRATGFPGTPLGIGMLMDNYGPVFARKAATLRFSVINSAPLPPDRTAQLQALLPQLEIMVYYGLTEASRSTFISLTRKGPEFYRSVGRPMAHAELRIVDASGLPVAGGAPGEILIRGAALSGGYWDSAEEERVAFAGGWLHTGDLGHLDADGYLWIDGRLKDVINVGGYKVSPTEVETALASFPGVLDAGVAGVEGLPGSMGEVVVAGLVTGPEFVVDEAALQQHCLATLEKFKVPARFVRVEAVPRTDTGKTRRADLSARLRDALGS